MNSDQQIYEMENEVFELETAKAKLNHEGAVKQLDSFARRKLSLYSSSTYLTPLQIKLRDTIVNPEQDTVVQRLYNDPTTFESNKIKFFVKKFIFLADRKFNKDEKKLAKSL